MVLRCSMAAAILALMAVEAIARPIGSGSDEQRIKRDDDRLVFTYRPTGCRARSLLLVFHGLGGRASSYRDSARGLADKMCLIVVAPQFAPHTQTYQLGGMVRRGVVKDPQDWTINSVTRISDWARKETGITQYYLIGHSAGAQFLSRVAAFLPTEARRIVIANPSTHVLPTLDVKEPYGLGGVYPPATEEAQLRRYLELPLTIYLGEADVGEDDDDLNVSPDAMAQGRTRFERGMKAFNDGKKLADSRGWTFNWRLVRARGIGHSARAMFSAPTASEALRP